MAHFANSAWVSFSYGNASSLSCYCNAARQTVPMQRPRCDWKEATIVIRAQQQAITFLDRTSPNSATDNGSNSRYGVNFINLLQTAHKKHDFA